MTHSSDSATISPMKADAPIFTQKLAKLMETRTAPAVAASAGIQAQSIYDYISKGVTPRALTCLRIAYACGVPVQWLIDDEMPIEPIPTAASLIDDDELMREVVKRFSASAIMLSSLLDRAERIDWEAAAAAMDENPNAREDDYDAKTEAAIDVADAMYLLITNTIDRFDSALIACDSRAVKFGEVDQRKGPLREWFFDRANAIYSRLTATDNARSTFMARLMGRAHVNEPDMIIGRLEEALTRYGV